MSERVSLTRTTEGYMGPVQRLDAVFATVTAKLSQLHVSQSKESVLSSQLALADGRAVELYSGRVDSAVVRVMHKSGELENYTFDLANHQPLVFEAAHMQDPKLVLDRHVVEANSLGIARAQEFDRLLLDCVDELPLLEDL